ncbi:MAG TPA: hypothetical protein GXX29_11040 [Firmicutes bacterium]|nr:hypothetical protein [Bacillota bacterium]
MRKEKKQLPDGRYLLLYSFPRYGCDAAAAAAGAGGSDRAEKDGNENDNNNKKEIDTEKQQPGSEN